jgi:hypothetical protein
MVLRVAQLIPSPRYLNAHSPDGIVHVVVGPAAGLPAKLAIGCLDPDFKPIDDRTDRRPLLQERLLWVDMEIQSPYLGVSPADQFFGSRVPPPLARLTHDVVRRFVELPGAEGFGPQDIRGRFGEAILRISPR